jgi:hypothetical protein
MGKEGNPSVGIHPAFGQFRKAVVIDALSIRVPPLPGSHLLCLNARPAANS